jgi:hypothetical protein
MGIAGRVGEFVMIDVYSGIYGYAPKTAHGKHMAKDSFYPGGDFKLSMGSYSVSV